MKEKIKILKKANKAEDNKLSDEVMKNVIGGNKESYMGAGDNVGAPFGCCSYCGTPLELGLFYNGVIGHEEAYCPNPDCPQKHMYEKKENVEHLFTNKS